MQILPTLNELQFVEIAEPGVPNRERIVLRVADSLTLIMKGRRDNALPLGEFCVIGGIASEETVSLHPFPNLFFWFGDVKASANAWVVIMTGKGEQQTQREPGKPDVHWFYWGRPNTAFNSQARMGAAVLHISEVLICAPPARPSSD